MQITKTSDGKINYPMYSLDGKLLLEDNRQLSKRTEYIYAGGKMVAKRIQTLSSTGSNSGAASTTTIHTDFLGSPVAETNASGTVTRVERYTPYGEPSDMQLDAGPGFTGHATDVATGLTNMQQRYMDAELGRFLTPDPIEANPENGQKFNRYVYASNNPIMFIDPDGRSDLNLFKPTDGLYEAGKAFDVPGMYTITGHATATFVLNQNNKKLNPSELLQNAVGLQGGQTIFLAACNTGSGGYAQELANLNNSLVIAPVGYAMFPSTKDINPNDKLNAYKPGNSGTISVSTDKKDRSGYFAAFIPGGKDPVYLPSNVSSVKFNTKTGDATFRLRPETGSRIGRTIVVKKEDK